MQESIAGRNFRGGQAGKRTGGARRGYAWDSAPAAQSVFDGVGMQAERGGDGADLPMLGIKEAANFSDGFRRDHHVTPRARRD
jgi:hypothetical protein